MRNKLTTRNSQTGFTIIEVVLVLAIAGLIFLIVFLALPQLQRSRRDTQRKTDAGRLLSAIESYSGNNNGEYPDTEAEIDGVVTGYLTNNSGVFNDPTTGTAYATTLVTADTGTIAAGNIQYNVDAVCDGGNFADGSGARDIAVAIHQESGGRYCQDNQ